MVDRPKVRAARAPWLVAGILVIGWLVLAHRYGFHRDELYFLEGGRHPAAGQPDNPILVPWLAASWHDVVGGDLTWFRLPPALAGAGTVLAAARTALALGGTTRQQTLTAVFVGLSSFPLAIGHLFSTATFDLLLTTVGVLLTIRAVREPQRLASWVRLGLVIGLALEVKLLAGAVFACCVVALVVTGPESVRGLRLFRLRGFWLATGLATVLAAPNLIWQATHGWPMLEVAASIAGGGSASSAARATVLPLMLLMVGPLLGPLMIVGVVAPWRMTGLRQHRWLGLGFGLLAALVVLTGGKPYYLAGLFAAGLALSTWPLLRWLDRARWRRTAALITLVVVTVPVAVFSLPLTPVGSLPFRVATSVNPDTAETVGWDVVIDATVEAVAAVPVAERERTVIIARNYGEAGALARARRLGLGSAQDTGGVRRDVVLPPVYSGHNAFWSWGPPPDTTSTVVLVGEVDPVLLRASFGRCSSAGVVHSPPGVDNEEDGAPLSICRDPLAPLPQLWPAFRRLG